MSIEVLAAKKNPAFWTVKLSGVPLSHSIVSAFEDVNSTTSPWQI